MAKDDAYFQFPIEILRTDCTTDQLFKEIFAYTLWNYGTGLWAKTDENVEQIAREYFCKFPDIPEFDCEDYNHNTIVAAAVRLHCRIDNLKEVVENNDVLTKYQRHGMFVRLRADYLWTAYYKNWAPVRLKTLCGVIASIGSHQYFKMTLRQIRAVGAGYSSPKGLTEEQLLPKSSVHRCVEDLWIKGMFQRVIRKHDTWYSVRHESDNALNAEITRDLAKKKRKQRVFANDVSTD